jgi:hypothetical protein
MAVPTRRPLAPTGRSNCRGGLCALCQPHVTQQLRCAQPPCFARGQKQGASGRDATSAALGATALAVMAMPNSQGRSRRGPSAPEISAARTRSAQRMSLLSCSLTVGCWQQHCILEVVSIPGGGWRSSRRREAVWMPARL